MRKFYPHQQEAYDYTFRVQHPALIMEMRMGKCLVTIRRCKLYAPGKILIVCPSSAIGGWIDELKQEGESYTVLLGDKFTRKALLGSFTRWFIINKEGFLSIPEIARIPWVSVILDESHFIKNPKARVSKFYLDNFRNVIHRWILTGTPNPEHDLELWNQMAFLYGKAFGYDNYYAFRVKEFFVQGTQWNPNPGVKEAIRDEINQKWFIKTRQQAGIFIDKVREIRKLDLPPDIRKKYNKAEEDFELDGERTLWSMVKYQWLHQLTGGYIHKELAWKGKIDELLSLLQGELRNQQVVVWFNYNLELAECYECLIENKITCAAIFGELSFEEREVQRKSFLSGEKRVILIQQAVAQTGMDLSCADTCIYYSENPASISNTQTQDRIIHLSKKTTLLYIYLIVKDSVDEDLHDALAMKRWNSSLTLSQALGQKIKERTHARLSLSQGKTS